MARPSDYGPEITAAICAKLSDGLSLREICRADDMPDKSTVMRWLAAHDEFRDQYARARELQADHFGDEILEISDDATNDWMVRRDGDKAVETVNSEHISRSKLRVDSRKWLMSKMAPKKYGDRITHAGDAENPVRVEKIERVIVDPNPPNPDRSGI